jgi:rod shape-determining protein MreB
MLFQLVRQWFSSDVLIEVSERQLSFHFLGKQQPKLSFTPIVSIEQRKGKPFIAAIGESNPKLNCVNPFSHPRTLCHHFHYAEKLFQHGIKQLHQTAIRPVPRVVIHPLEKLEGGLTDVEQRFFKELALASGARAIAIYQGQRLNPSIESFDSIQARIASQTQAQQ